MMVTATTEKTPRVIDVQAFIDAQSVSWEQKRLLILCFLVIAIDGFDTAIVGFIAPAIRAEWHLHVTQLGPLFAAGLFGLMLGAFAVGPLADRHGRTIMLVVSMVVFVLARLTGDPLELMMPAEATKEDIAMMRAYLGLDRPWPVQYWRFISRAVQGEPQVADLDRFYDQLEHRLEAAQEVPPEALQRLGEQRATTVVDTLVAGGVPADRASATPAKPVDGSPGRLPARHDQPPHADLDEAGGDFGQRRLDRLA